MYFFFNDTATTEIYTLSLHDALPILLLFQVVFAAPFALTILDLAGGEGRPSAKRLALLPARNPLIIASTAGIAIAASGWRSEEHTSELQSRQYLVCRLLLEKKE